MAERDDTDFKLGDIVETVKGAEFWGEIIAFDNDGESAGCTVKAIAPGFRRTKHVYPLGQLRRRALPADAGEAVAGWIIGNGTGLKWRCWKDGMPSWTNDPAQAMRYARRSDAEEACREDEDAWIVTRYPVASDQAAPSPAPAVNAGMVEALRAACARIEKTMCPTFSSDAGDMGLQGRISKADFDLLHVAALASAEASPPPPVGDAGVNWKDDPSADERWNAGLDYGQTQLCKVLGVDPNTVRWDAATETLDGDVQSVICGILTMRFGEDWPDAALSRPSGDGWRHQPWMSKADWNGGKWLSHDEAMQTISDASSVVTLSYEEAAMIYARGRGFIVDDARMMADAPTPPSSGEGHGEPFDRMARNEGGQP